MAKSDCLNRKTHLRIDQVTSTKHNIKRVDRLLGNEALHQELPQLYQTLAQKHLAHLKHPVILIDWSDLTPDRRWQVLRAALALEGRSVTLYEQVHPQPQAGTLCVHWQFLARLASLLSSGCVPILVTDAGFRATWFKLVNRMGWHWIGRIRDRDMVRRAGEHAWSGCKHLYACATETPCCLGQFDYVRSNPVRCRLVVVKHRRKGRHKRTALGKPSRAHHSLKNARRQREPWLLATSPGLEHLSANAVVAVYSKRMQIEEEFRDLKNEHSGLGSFLLRLIGEIARAHHMERQCQSNTRRSRPVLSLVNLARQLAGKGQVIFPYYEFMAALRHLRRRFCIQEI